ncbi:MAG: hypothetical protein E7012_03175 [Alphaproteobacteria bacterium]|nr:hypothetical protein [Alphaproteobacteria bacterium]
MKFFKGATSVLIDGTLVVDGLVVSYPDRVIATIIIDIETPLPVYIKKRQKLMYEAYSVREMIENIGLSKCGHKVRVRLPIKDDGKIYPNIMTFENLTLKIGETLIIEI